MVHVYSVRTRESVQDPDVGAQMLGVTAGFYFNQISQRCVVFFCNFKERCMTRVALCVLTRVVVRAPRHENPQHVGPAPAATGCGDPSRQRCRHLDRRLRPFLSERNRYSAVRQTASCAPPGRVAKPPKVPMAHRLNCRGNSPRRHRRNMRAKSNVCVGRHASNGPQLGWGQCPAMASPTSLVCGHRHAACPLDVHLQRRWWHAGCRRPLHACLPPLLGPS